jgi:hypothetical protein
MMGRGRLSIWFAFIVLRSSDGKMSFVPLYRERVFSPTPQKMLTGGSCPGTNESREADRVALAKRENESTSGDVIV